MRPAWSLKNQGWVLCGLEARTAAATRVNGSSAGIEAQACQGWNASSPCSSMPVLTARHMPAAAALATMTPPPSSARRVQEEGADSRAPGGSSFMG